MPKLFITEILFMQIAQLNKLTKNTENSWLQEK